jgi:hypothetical protein
MGKHNRSEMVAVQGTLFALQPHNSNQYLTTLSYIKSKQGLDMLISNTACSHRNRQLYD